MSKNNNHYVYTGRQGYVKQQIQMFYHLKCLAYGLFVWLMLLNVPIVWRRAQTLLHDEAVQNVSWWGLALTVPMSRFVALGLELLLLCALCYGVCLLVSVHRWVARWVGAVLVIISTLCAFYMIFFNVVIGYGIVQALFTTEFELAQEIIGYKLLIWFAFIGLPVLFWLFRKTKQPKEVQKIGFLFKKTRKHHSDKEKQRKNIDKTKIVTKKMRRYWFYKQFLINSVVLFTVYYAMNAFDKGVKKASHAMERPKQSAVAAHSYLPSNWLAASSMAASNWIQESMHRAHLPKPTETFNFELNEKDLTVVVVIGETARFDHMGALGYSLDTTPFLSDAIRKQALFDEGKSLQDPPNGRWAVFQALSCNTSTKLSLACMFVKPNAVKHGSLEQADEITQDNVFSVFKHLGFEIKLFGMQSEIWFYNRVYADEYKIREVIAAQPRNAGKAIDDMMLVDELKEALEHKKQGNRLIILHTKGSHFLYSQRYPRRFAKWTPECQSVDQPCSRQALIHAYDNSILYTDAVLEQIRQVLQKQKALMVYVSDHGESIDENYHLHGTPKQIAPIEQRRVPLMFWMSDAYLSSAVGKKAFKTIDNNAKAFFETKEPKAKHEHLFDSLLGCSGVTSNNAGVDERWNLCAKQQL